MGKNIGTICHCGMMASRRYMPYCSEYCGAYKEGNYSKTPAGHFPAIPISCDLCEKVTDWRKHDEKARRFCCHGCKKKVLSSSIRRPLMNYYLLSNLKRNGGWISAQGMISLMEANGMTGTSARWSNLMARWVRLGVVEKWQERSETPTYRFRSNIKKPVGKIIIDKGA
jgi:endogenous inhibitor of DNA gyrase (YacG/DUF329 family)